MRFEIVSAHYGYGWADKVLPSVYPVFSNYKLDIVTDDEDYKHYFADLTIEDVVKISEKIKTQLIVDTRKLFDNHNNIMIYDDYIE